MQKDSPCSQPQQLRLENQPCAGGCHDCCPGKSEAHTQETPDAQEASGGPGMKAAQGQVLESSQEQSPALVKAAQAEALEWG